MANALTTALANTRKVLQKQGTSLLDVVRAIQTDATNELPVALTPPAPKAVAVTDRQREVLDDLLATVTGMVLPTGRRKLRKAEMAKVLGWTEDLKEAEKVVKNAIEQVKIAFFNHADLIAEDAGRANPRETPRDKNGFYLQSDLDSGVVDGEPFKLTREFRNGSVELTVDSLDELVRTNIISAAERKSLVRTVEVVDENAVVAYLAQNHEKIPLVAAKVSQKSSPSVSFHLRKNA